jgi:Asp-tRNA(Asn)/Glu-tRNA(Gln) amidotransferase A subunit family amidase
LRIAYSVRDFRGIRVHPECEAAVLETARLLEGLGHEVTEAAPQVDGTVTRDAFLDWWAAMTAQSFGAVLTARETVDPRIGQLRRLAGDPRTMRLLSRLTKRETGLPAFEPFTLELVARSARQAPADLLSAEIALQAVAHEAGRFLQSYDMLLTPVLGSPPLPLGAIDQTLPYAELIELLARYVAFTPLANFSGLPAMSVPLYWTDDGLPVGSHFMGRFGGEEVLFALAGQLEAARPWANRRAPVHATSSTTGLKPEA